MPIKATTPKEKHVQSKVTRKGFSAGVEAVCPETSPIFEADCDWERNGSFCFEAKLYWCTLERKTVVLSDLKEIWTYEFEVQTDRYKANAL